MPGKQFTLRRSKRNHWRVQHIFAQSEQDVIAVDECVKSLIYETRSRTLHKVNTNSGAATSRAIHAIDRRTRVAGNTHMLYFPIEYRIEFRSAGVREY